MSTAILDADVIAYTACIGKATGVDWGDGVRTEPSHALSHKIKMADAMVQDWTEYAGCTTTTLAFSGSSADNFRRKVNPEYKAKRGPEKPEGYAQVVGHLQATYRSFHQQILEGDDILGLHLTEGLADVVVSTDKDIFTLPGKVLRIPRNGPILGPIINSELEADRYWMMQTLAGDAVDGYRGCAGIGLVGAKKLMDGLGSLGSMWRVVMSTYEKQSRHKSWGKKFLHKGDPLKEALMNARCARILRHGDYQDNEVKLWMT